MWNKLMFGKKAWLLALALMYAASSAFAANYSKEGLTIKRIRAVGDYEGTTFDNTIELWFTTDLDWPTASQCGTGSRVYIDAKNKHMVATAMLAFSLGKKVNINIDTSLPNRYGACEVSYLDIDAS